MNVISSDFDHLGSVLGTPTAQKLVMLLITWDTLSLQDLITKSGFSKSQVHTTLKNLIHLDIVNSPSRGIYKNSDSQFAKLLKEAYLAKLHELINVEMYSISELLKKKNLELAQKKFDNLVLLYDPILKGSFRYILSSLSHQFIEVLEPLQKYP